MPTDMSEQGLETLIVATLLGHTTPPVSPLPAGRGAGGEDARSRPGAHTVADPAAVYVAAAPYVAGDPATYDRANAVDLPMLLRFLAATQPRTLERLGLAEPGPARAAFLARLRDEIAKRGVVDVLRKGVKDGPHQVTLFYGTPSAGNAEAAALHAANVFSVTRQLKYSTSEVGRALDMAIFLNGLPLFTFELKNSLTRQTVVDAIAQYRQDRSPRELLFQPGRCVAHFAVDEHEVHFCTALKGPASQFLPFNKGNNGGAGNPPNPAGLKTAYLWEEVLTPAGVVELLERYATAITVPGSDGKKQTRWLFPRYHQREVVRRLLADAQTHGAGRRYLIQHSAGSGKSNSIAWLAHQLVELQRDGGPVFDSVVVVTDRTVLDTQIRETIRSLAQVSHVVGGAQSSGDLRQFLAQGKKIVVTTIQKFPYILDAIGDEHRGKRFAIIIDEAHSSQGGKASGSLASALGDGALPEGDWDAEDEIVQIVLRKKLLTNASYFAFTATPKNKTLEMFGTLQPDGSFAPFHVYSMRQAIQEGFIVDVLANYTPIESYYHLIKAIPDDPEFDVKKAQKRLRKYVEGHHHAIGEKARLIVDHFHDSIWQPRKMAGQARAMVVTKSIRQAVEYHLAIEGAIRERGYRFGSLVAFSGEIEHGGRQLTEADFNGFPSAQIPERFRSGDYRLLVVADKFQTGYDEPLLMVMYVDKPLSGVKAVQTLSRLNRSHPDKRETLVLDFCNDPEAIREAFQPYYQATMLSGRTDANKLHDLLATIEGLGLYTPWQAQEVVDRFLAGKPRTQIDPLLDEAVAAYSALELADQILFKGKVKAFVRTYNYLSAIVPYVVPEWERASIFLGFLLPRLPSPADPDDTRSVLESVDLDSYRIEKQAAIRIALSEEDGAVAPIPTSDKAGLADPMTAMLTEIVRMFNEIWGNTEFTDRDRVARMFTDEIIPAVDADEAYRHARLQGDRQNARIEHDRALQTQVLASVANSTELYRAFMENPDFQRMLSDACFAATYQPPRQASLPG